MDRSLVVAVAGALAACSPHPPPAVTPQPAAGAATTRDPALELRAAHLQLRLLENEARIEDYQAKLDDARQEVVRAMAKLQTLATKAEAASGMAEAKITLDSLRPGAGPQPPPEVAQAARLLQQSGAAFDNGNYGGALYLANQAKSVASAGQGLLASRDQGAVRQGEVPFALPLRLRTIGAGNLRSGPGTTFKVLAALEAGTAVVAYAYVDMWVRVRDENGHSGWMFYNLVGRRKD